VRATFLDDAKRRSNCVRWLTSPPLSRELAGVKVMNAIAFSEDSLRAD
jgi:hypothetical protein